jgi:hypothetical protein
MPTAPDDATHRFEAAAAFVGLSDADRKRIRLSRRFLGPMLPQLSQVVARRIVGTPQTRRHFEHDGPADPEVVSRHLLGWVSGLLAVVASDGLPVFLARVGPAHTPGAGDARVSVPPWQLDAMLGFLGDQIKGAIAETVPDPAQRLAAIRSWDRLLWVQRAMMEPGLRGGS